MAFLVAIMEGAAVEAARPTTPAPPREDKGWPHHWLPNKPSLLLHSILQVRELQTK